MKGPAGVRVLALFFSTALFLPASAKSAEGTAVAGGRLGGNTVWEGQHVVSGTVSVPKGVRLEIRAGSNIVFVDEESGLLIEGSLEATGSAGLPITFGPLGEGGYSWDGVRVTDGAKAHFIHTIITGAAVGIAVSGSEADVQDCILAANGIGVDASLESRFTGRRARFTDNGTGLRAQLKSRVEVENSRFLNNSAAGIVFQTSAGGRVEECVFEGGTGLLAKGGSDIFLGGNTFKECEKGVIFDEVRRDVRLVGNSFLGGTLGVLCRSFATPWTACNEFHGLDVAMAASRHSGPLVEWSRFKGNRRAIEATNKSDFPVRNNVFKENVQAVFIDLSSYPKVHDNNFLGKGKAVVLGIYMSADWEKKVGSARISGNEARRKGSRNLGGVSRRGDFSGEVDLRNNWWGEETLAEMIAAGPDGNIDAIHDYFDRNEVTYPGFSEGSYRVDRVLYSPWREESVEEAGPRQKGCGDLPPVPPRPARKGKGPGEPERRPEKWQADR